MVPPGGAKSFSRENHFAQPGSLLCGNPEGIECGNAGIEHRQVNAGKFDDCGGTIHEAFRAWSRLLPARARNAARRRRGVPCEAGTAASGRRHLSDDVQGSWLIDAKVTFIARRGQEIYMVCLFEAFFCYGPGNFARQFRLRAGQRFESATDKGRIAFAARLQVPVKRIQLAPFPCFSCFARLTIFPKSRSRARFSARVAVEVGS